MRTLIRSRRGLTYLEVTIVVCVGAMLLFAFVALVPRPIHDGSNRIKCASNLRQIGQAMLLYGNENRGAMPRGIYVVSSVVVPTWGTGAAVSNPFAESGPVNDVSAGLFLLLRTQDITPDAFVCPVSSADKWDFGGGSNTAANWSNWNDVRKNLSYSMHNPYLDEEVQSRFTDPQSTSPKWGWDNTIGSEFAVAADMNPGIVKGKINLLTVTTTSSSRDMQSANSPNHAQDGQNVLYGDGHVSFEQTPFVGVQRDNIYLTTAGKVTGSMQDEKDSILLPAAQ